MQNVIGHFLLTKLLLPVLIRTTESNPPSGKARVITTSGSIYKLYPRVNYDALRDSPERRKISPQKLYAQSKFGNILMSNELARRYEDKIVSICLHPGVFQTELTRHQEMPTWGPMKWLWVRLAACSSHAYGSGSGGTDDGFHVGRNVLSCLDGRAKSIVRGYDA